MVKLTEVFERRKVRLLDEITQRVETISADGDADVREKIIQALISEKQSAIMREAGKGNSQFVISQALDIVVLEDVRKSK
jgi:hypothetical protein